MCCSLFINLLHIRWFIIVYFGVFVKRKINVLGVLPEDAPVDLLAVHRRRNNRQESTITDSTRRMVHGKAGWRLGIKREGYSPLTAETCSANQGARWFELEGPYHANAFRNPMLDTIWNLPSRQSPARLVYSITYEERHQDIRNGHPYPVQ